MRRSLTLTALTGMAAVTLAIPVASASTAAPTQTTTPYAAVGTAALLTADAGLPIADLGIADVTLSSASTRVSTEETPRSNAAANQLDATLLDQVELDPVADALLTPALTQTAPPDNAEPEVREGPISAPENPLANLTTSRSTVHARWPGDGVCLAPGESISNGKNETEDATVLPIPGLGSLVTVTNEAGGLTATESDVTTAEVAGQSGRALVSTSSSQIDEVTLFADTPLEINVQVGATPTLTATANGSPGGAAVDYNAPGVTITSPTEGLLGGTPLELGDFFEEDGLIDFLDTVITGLDEAILAALADAGLIVVDVQLAEDQIAANPFQVNPDGTSASGAVSVVRINVQLLPALGEDPLLDATVEVAPLSAAAVVSPGGIDCNPDLPECSDGEDNDGEGTIDIDDPNCHTDGDPDNPDSYDPNDDDESSQCNDGVDNEDPEDTLADADDPGCHTDGNATNPDSYDPNDDDEANAAQAPRRSLPKTGDDVPLAAALLVGGMGLVALQLIRRRRSV